MNTPPPASRPPASFWVWLPPLVFHLLLLAGLLVANAVDDESTHWTDAAGYRASLWDIEGRYTMLSHATAQYLFLAAAGCWVLASTHRQRVGLLAAVCGLLWASADEWLHLHTALRDGALASAGIGNAAALGPLLDPFMAAYAVAGCVAAWAVLRDATWSRPARAYMTAGAAMLVAVFVLDGAGYVYWGYDTTRTGIEELLQLSAAFAFAATAYVGIAERIRPRSEC